MRERTIPRATYRLQFSKDFTFAHATDLVPYFQALGISHLYASPCLKARAGSSHGYDIVDHDSLNPELGGTEQFKILVDTLHAHGMGLILDLVPNHMGITGGENSWWWDVLENGQASPFASYFDIDWHPIKEELRGKVLLPVLGDHYGKVIESGELALEFDEQRGQFGIRYWEHRFPIDPESYSKILGCEIERLTALAAEESHLMTEWHTLIADFEQLRAVRNMPQDRARAGAACKQRLTELHGQSPSIRRFLQEKLVDFNGRMGEPSTFDKLHQLLEQQSYRLAYWRVASDEINYRRFFDINELACLCQENPEVFEATHRLVFALIADGSVDGLRIDHVDGLYDPAAYCRRLRDEVYRMAGEKSSAPEARQASPLYLVVEKILAGFEHLREDWPIDGTTGYEFSALVNGLFVYPEAENALTRVYTHFVGHRPPFEDQVYQCKRQVIRTQLSGELTMLANMLNRIAQAQRSTRDYTLNSLREALTDVVACFPVYRTYITAEGGNREDRRFVEWAIAQAKKRSSASADIIVFDFLRDILLLENPDAASEEFRSRVQRFAMRFQQYTAPVMAKGMEDTAFYMSNRLLSLNEVGGDPRRFSVSVAAFHHANQQRLHRWPHAMLNTSTHDSKRSEDVRARLNVISELAAEWRLHLSRWRRLNSSKKTMVDDAAAPSKNDEYRLYQTLVGTWPVEMGANERMGEYRERVVSYMLKAVREAKVHTSWINPNSAYEEAVIAFVTRVLSSPMLGHFFEDFCAFHDRVARLGLYNGLSQTLLKLTSPGVPDIYQGSELWKFTLVDPDNRGPVDFVLRKRLLRQLEQIDAGELCPAFLEDLLTHAEDGRAKLYLVSRTLTLRRRYPKLFEEGDYLPLEVHGEKAEHLCAFARHRNGVTVIVVVARWFSRLLKQSHELPIGKVIWGNSRIQAPEWAGTRPFRNVFSGAKVRASSRNGLNGFDVGAVLADFPVALLFN